MISYKLQGSSLEIDICGEGGGLEDIIKPVLFSAARGQSCRSPSPVPAVPAVTATSTPRSPSCADSTWSVWTAWPRQGSAAPESSGEQIFSLKIFLLILKYFLVPAHPGLHHPCPGEIFRLCSHWSSNYITALPLVENFKVMKYFQSGREECVAAVVAEYSCPKARGPLRSEI